MKKLTKETMEQVNGGKYTWVQCDVWIEGGPFGRYQCGKIFSSNKWGLFVKAELLNQLKLHKNEVHGIPY